MSGFLLIVAACILWAADTLIRYPLLFSGVSAERIVFTEHLLLVLLMLPLVWKTRKIFFSLSRGHFFCFCIIGGLGSAYATLAFTKAFSLINPSLVILLQKLQPIVAISLATMLIGERIKASFLVFTFVALVGAFFISMPDLLQGFKKSSLLHEQAIWGYLLALFAVIAWGCSTVFGKKLSTAGFSEAQIMFGRFVCGCLALMPLLFAVEIEFDSSLSVNSKIFAMVMISGLGGMWLYYQGLKRVSAHVSALAEMFFPLCAVTINWIFLGKPLEAIQVFGAVLLIASSTVIQIKKL